MGDFEYTDSSFVCYHTRRRGINHIQRENTLLMEHAETKINKNSLRRRRGHLNFIL